MKKNWPLVLIALLFAAAGYANDFYTHGNFPSPSSPATSAAMRAELDLISAGFDKLPALTSNAGRAVVVNSGGTGLTVTTGTLLLGGNLAISGSFNTTLVQQASTTLTLPGASGTLATLAGTETLSGKTLSSPIINSPTFSGTATGSLTGLSLISPAFTSPVFSTIINVGTLTLPAVTDTLVGRATTDTLTNKTLTAPTISAPTFSGTAAGSLTNLSLTTPTIASPTVSGTASGSLTGLALTNSVITTSTVAADPTVSLGIASKQYVDALWTTGDVKLTLKTSADAGWVLMNDGTIGSATSGATTRANADTSSLYTLIWTNCIDQWCPVTTGRGASAAADFAANKPLALPKTLGRALAGYGTGVVTHSGVDADVDVATNDTFSVASNNTKWVTGMPVVLTLTSGTITGLTSGNTYYIIRASTTTVKLASSLLNAQNGNAIDMTAKSSPVWTLTHTYTARVMGESVGEQEHAMSDTELLAHVHSVRANSGGANVAAGSNLSYNTTSTGSFGGNAAMNIMQPTLFLNVMVKL